jgi:EmrB/QacA subfamily drug resistance transporter
MLLSSLGTSVANVALPTLAEAFDASFQAVQWIVLAYLLASTTLIVSVGRLGDLIGRRRLLLVGIALFTVTSLACALAPALWVLIAARAAQGLGAAIMMSLSIAFVAESVPNERRGSAMGLLGTMSAIGTALGPSLGGALIALSGWRAIFLVNLPLGLLTFVLSYRSLAVDRKDAEARAIRFDITGTVLLVFTLAAYALAMTMGRGSFGPLNVVLLFAAVCIAALFVRVELRSASPLIHLETFRDRVLSSNLGLNAIVMTVMMATLVVGPFFLAHGLKLNAADVGLVLSVGPLVAAVAGLPAGWLVDRFGTYLVSITGLVAIAVGSLLMSTMPATLDVSGYIIRIVIITAGHGLFQAANNTRVMMNVPSDRKGGIAGLLNLSRNLGLITGASVMGAIFTVASATIDSTSASPGNVATGMRTTFTVASALMLISLAVAVVPRSLSRLQRLLPLCAVALLASPFL